MPIWVTRCWVFSLGVPARASPATSPFTSAMNTGTPRREKPSAITMSVTVLPVPVAPAPRVGGEDLPRAQRGRQDLLVPRELDDRLERLTVSGHTVRQRVVTHDAPSLRERLGVARERGGRIELLQEGRLGFLERAEDARRQRRVGLQERVLHDD